jgi:hypothetical protein
MLRYLSFALVLAGCGAAVDDPTISAEPPERAIASAHVDPVADDAPTLTTPPELREAPPAPLLLSPDPVPAPAAPPTDSNAPPPGYHDAGACYLPNVLKAGDCACAVYDSTGHLVTVGTQCFDACSYNDDGVTVMHSFCVPGGLTADKTLR